MRVLVALLFVGTAHASTVTLSTGPSCTYQGLTVDAQGNVVVQCQGSRPLVPPIQPPPQPPGTCPAPDGNMQVKHFGNAGDKLEIMAYSGQITSIPLPKVPNDGRRGSGYLNMLDSPALYTPPSSVLEVSISKCPGVIDTSPNACNTSFRDVGYVSYYWFARTTARFNSPEAISAAKACYAPESEGQWYLNVRWTYQTCSFGAATCGFKFYWSPGAH